MAGPLTADAEAAAAGAGAADAAVFDAAESDNEAMGRDEGDVPAPKFRKLSCSEPPPSVRVSMRSWPGVWRAIPAAPLLSAAAARFPALTAPAVRPLGLPPASPCCYPAGRLVHRVPHQQPPLRPPPSRHDRAPSAVCFPVAVCAEPRAAGGAGGAQHHLPALGSCRRGQPLRHRRRGGGLLPAHHRRRADRGRILCVSCRGAASGVHGRPGGRLPAGSITAGH